MALSIRLSRPLEAHGETVEALELREPTGADVEALGMPCVLRSDESLKMEGKTLCAYVARLGGVPPSAVRAMAPADLTACYLALLPFFFPGSTEAAPD